MEQKMCSLTIDKETKQYPLDTTFQQIADEYQKQFESRIVLVKFQNDLKELSQSVLRDGSLEFITSDQKPGRDTYRRSLTLLMETAAWKLYPNLELLVQHSIGQGYYCEFRHKDAICVPDRKMLFALKEKMQDFVKADLPIIKYNMNTQDASTRFREMGRMDKVRLLRYRRSSRVNVYELQEFPDYYYGYMVPSTGYLEYFDLLPYQNGFMLMFPGKDPKIVAEFSSSDKLFRTLNDSAQWGIDMGIRTVGELNDVIASGRMQDMILVQESYMEQKIGDIAETIASDRRKKFVLIAGPSSSGKTTFSHRLSIQMTAHGLKPHPISLDDFYCNREETPLDENGEFDFECLEALDIPLFNQCMTDLLAGKEVTLPVFNFKTGHREYRQKPLKMGPDDVLVIEGIHGLNEKLSYELPKENKYKIYISALTQLNIDDHNNLSTADGRLIRRMVRDARTRNTTARETLARWHSVRRGEEKNIFPYQEEADIMFNSALIYELSVLKLYAEPLLFSIDNTCPEYPEAKRLLKFLDYFLPVPGENIGHNSILREFIGGSCFHV